MAGDWLKVEVTLPDKPEVWQIAGILGLDADAVVGKLIRVWAWFDAHTEKGNAHGVTYALLDRISGVSGFAEAMAVVGWLCESGMEVSLPRFDRHNGKTAKNRALTAKRVAGHKAKSNDEGNAVSVTSALPREEKRREEQKPYSSSGDDPGADGAKVSKLDERLAEVTRDAIETWNASELVAGGLAKVRESVGFDKRKQQVRRMLQVAREICAEQLGSQTITRQFWVGLWREYAKDDFFAGRQGGGRGHENWRPDFDYLTHPKTVLKLYDRSATEAQA